MIKKAKDNQLEVIDKAIQHIHRSLPPQEAALIEQFARHYYHSASPDDLARLSVIDLYGAIVSHWHFISARKPGEDKVRVYNPQFEQNGWQSTHSVIEIICDDMPFLMDSVRLELNRRGLSLHLILHTGNMWVDRDDKGQIKELSFKKKRDANSIMEAPMFIEFDKQSDLSVLEDIKRCVEVVLEEVKLCVQDWPKMSEKMVEVIDALEQTTESDHTKKSNEDVDFLKWIKADNFTFLAYCKVKFQITSGVKEWVLVDSTELGIFKRGLDGYFDKLQDLPEPARAYLLSKDPLLLAKTNERSKIHRPANPDLIAVKTFNNLGEVTEMHCFIGLYTSAAYNLSTQDIPLLHRKVKHVLKAAGFSPNTHDGKALMNILETIPRDDMFLASEDEIYRLAMGILYMQERRRIKLFIRRDIFGHFYSCLAFVPRDRFNSDIRITFSKILEEDLHGRMVDFTSRFSESVLCRVHFIIQVNPKATRPYDEQTIENRLRDSVRTWDDNLKDALIEHFGEEEGNRLIHQYGHAFPAGYKENFVARTAVYDIAHMETLVDGVKLGMSFYRPLEESEESIRFKLFHRDNSIALSDIIPMLECMGLRIISERPHLITTHDKTNIWINDFGMVHESSASLNVEAVKDIFQEAFSNIWYHNAESDGFNRLVLKAGLQWQEVTMLRAYAKYLWQIGFTFSQSYLEEALAKHADIARQLVELFVLRFDPTLPQETKNERIQMIRKKIKQDLEMVDNLDEDRILRRYMQVIMATIRTNYFQLKANGQPKDYLSFKLDPAAIPDMPLPKPMYEIFVYSPRFEGVHLRGAKVARGGIRWSDRREDFRTEVLGLMKAQQVKNAVIVPLGAKGGFFPKQIKSTFTRDQVMQEGIACYKTLIRGMLDITDNIVNHKVVPPENVVRYDGDDPYLVVAADKGTATFSDIANAVSQEYHFWLDDAFASGGSSGYDHKKMGITARGAWESVKRHFAEMNFDIHNTDFTVVGIGDMSGDVFGNGMLMSDHILLVAAFNHMHIFIDPTPDPRVSFAERKRLFELPRSSWTDYNPELISHGGGVFPRSAKSIMLTPEMRSLLGVQQDKMIPNDLIRAILKAKVDLLWNGGIGTYVKASSEHNSEVGDRTNDAVRINGSELRCKVVAEGGNLGLTQLGRIEYALQGGRLNTDAIDNSAGVDCSDHEVNIKILLNAVITKGDMTLKQRDELLESMTDEVAALVLLDNKEQTKAISLAALNQLKDIEMYSRVIDFLESEFNLDRKIEFLPDQEAIQERKQNKQGLTRPELAVLLAYCKTWLKQELLASDLPEDPTVACIMETAFPKILKEKYSAEMHAHRLRREIIVMQLANQTINTMGMTFVSRIQDETGATAPEIVKAYMTAKEVFSQDEFAREVEVLNFTVDNHVLLSLLHEFNRLIRRATRWFIRHARTGAPMDNIAPEFKMGVDKVIKDIRTHLKAEIKEYLEQSAKEYMDANVPTEMSYKGASLNVLSAALDIVEAAVTYHLPLLQVIKAYFIVGTRLDLEWFRQEIKQNPVTSHWDSLARAAFRDDLDSQQRNLTIAILQMEGDSMEVEAKMDAWLSHHKVMVDRFKQLVTDLKAQPVRNFTMYSVALRELFDLSHASSQIGLKGKMN